MAIRDKESLLNAIRERIGDEVDDGSLGLIEDVSDTIDNYENNRGEDWRKKYEENDQMWRQRYRDRFYGKVEDDALGFEAKTEEKTKTTFEDLFN